MTSRPASLPGLATDAELAVGPAVVKCRLCKHPLATREARLLGYGENCAHKLGLRPVRPPGRFDVEQDVLPGA